MQASPAGGLERVAARSTLVLTHYGRKTGKPYQVKIWFMVDGGRIYLSTANANRQWVRNVQKTPRVRLSVGGEPFEGEARFLTDRSEHERVMAMVRRKYWMYRPLFALWRAVLGLGLVRDSTGSFEVTLSGS